MIAEVSWAPTSVNRHVLGLRGRATYELFAGNAITDVQFSPHTPHVYWGATKFSSTLPGPFALTTYAALTLVVAVLLTPKEPPSFVSYLCRVCLMPSNIA